MEFFLRHVELVMDVTSMRLSVFKMYMDIIESGIFLKLNR